MRALHTIALAAALLAQAATAQTLPPPPVSPTPITRYEYDAQGNRTKIIRGAGTLNLETKLGYDPLYRVRDHTDPKNGKTSFEYDGGDRTTKVTDPRSLVTQYPRDGFGNATQLISPDTGTASQTYNEIGNLTTRTDSRGVLETYSYDAMDRLTQLVYSQSGQANQTVSWAYDLKGPDYSYSANRLSRTDHPNGWSRFKYDQRGRVLEAVQSVSPAAGANSTAIVSTTSYGYTLGRLTSITYPSGRKVVQSYTSRHVTGIGLAQDTNGTPTPLLSNIKWEPFGPVTSWNWNMAGGTTPHERFYDLSGRVTRYRLGNVFRDVTYDAADRIISFTHLSANDGIPQPALDQNFGYDENDHITQITTVASSWSITYDPNGNRTGVSLNGSPSVYNVEATSNRLASITNPARSFGYDNAGNTITDNPNYTATYGLSGSLASITKAGVTGTYTYDADKRRIRKVTSAGASSTVIFVYGLNGELLGEYDQTGKAIREYVWLDDIPVAMFIPDPANPSGPPLIFYVHADHLNSPRIVVDMNNATRWRWFAEPFGTTASEVNPSGLGVFTQNLRFPGQYADAESGLWYNYFRNYDPSRGGYPQSDPIGLAGGSASTYTYVDGNPLLVIDPDGRNAAWAIYRSWRFGWEAGSELYPVIEPALTPIVDRLLLPDVMPAVPVPPSSIPKVVPRDIWWPDRTAGQWSCRARADCNDNIPGNCPVDPSKRFAFGGGSANDLGTARNIAKANATSNLQCQPKHVSCKCTGPKREQYSGGC
ncbi:RHS repeat-associated core domain-containing protein [Rhizobacter sp. P5_C2]